MMADGDDDQNVLLVDGSDGGMMLFWLHGGDGEW